ncbi:DoxX family protein [Nonomuraea sp. MCN248]|uniref:DoxX family protein n=1 Tax=Nonomuraea corallina TaxID=2989783 RepID=A0ABT4SG43_9ACTN|nr:DoxX family protein [Nonomuraea corallina]MDA0636179.1 DoxX family protein [Nonomuraea corallina]
MKMIQTRPSTGRRLAGAGLWVLQVVAAGVFLMAALGKFTGAEPSASTFEALGWGEWFRYLVGAVEVVGAVALLVPALSGAAALAFTGLMAGATLTEAFVSGGPVAMPLALLVISGVIAWGRRDRTVRLWRSVSRR